MLDDSRWFIVRHAADLLGEMRVAEAAQPLAELLRHPEERVRRAATRALGCLDVPLALEAVGRSLSDPETPVRLEAAATLAARKSERAAALLAAALGTEHDIEVQHALLAGLGRVATADAVDALTAMAAATGGLFTQKKNTSLRVAAIFALGDTRTPAAFAALKSLANDREKEVRDAVARALNAPRSSAA
jgi:HEAT repeat protein